MRHKTLEIWGIRRMSGSTSTANHRVGFLIFSATRMLIALSHVPVEPADQVAQAEVEVAIGPLEDVVDEVAPLEQRADRSEALVDLRRREGPPLVAEPGQADTDRVCLQSGTRLLR